MNMMSEDKLAVDYVWNKTLLLANKDKQHQSSGRNKNF